MGNIRLTSNKTIFKVKTPLTVIKGYANLLRRQGFRDEAMAQDAIQAIYNEATRIQKMTETFLDLASLDSSLELREIDLVTLCQSTIKELKSVHQREINLYFDESPLMIMVDESRIKQVMIILLDNALKYSNDKIDCTIGKTSQNIVIGVKDYGIGIPKDEIENIFDRFYRVDKARSRETGGNGLGLHIADSIMKLHNGKIGFVSEEGKGTLAELILPISI
nr:HAMP domain-containing sensor histidine kinase [uncultured Aminipila sp.]